MPTSIQQLLLTKRFEPEIIPTLEDHLRAQCEQQTYDKEANLALLKLYQFHPTQTKLDVVSLLLLKSLMHLPNNDYRMCTYLCSEQIFSDPTVVAIVQAASHLEKCAFRSFWAHLASSLTELIPTIAGFEEAIRTFMLDTMQCLYQSVPIAHVRESLNVNDSSLKPIIEARSWAVDGEIVKIPLNENNQARPQTIEQGSIDAQQMVQMLRTSFM